MYYTFYSFVHIHTLKYLLAAAIVVSFDYNHKPTKMSAICRAFLLGLYAVTIDKKYLIRKTNKAVW